MLREIIREVLAWWRAREQSSAPPPPAPKTWTQDLKVVPPPTPAPFTWEDIHGILVRAPELRHVAGRLSCGGVGQQATNFAEINCATCAGAMSIYLQNAKLRGGPC